MRFSLEQGWLSFLPVTRGYNRWAERATLIQDVDYGRERRTVKHKVLRKSKNRVVQIGVSARTEEICSGVREGCFTGHDRFAQKGSRPAAKATLSRRSDPFRPAKPDLSPRTEHSCA